MVTSRTIHMKFRFNLKLIRDDHLDQPREQSNLFRVQSRSASLRRSCVFSLNGPMQHEYIADGDISGIISAWEQVWIQFTK